MAQLQRHDIPVVAASHAALEIGAMRWRNYMDKLPGFLRAGFHGL